MSVVAIIPAKGESKRIPGKNIKIFHGHPIIAYSIKVAKESSLFDDIIVTTDSDEVQEVALSYGATIHRRSKIWCDDDVGTNAVAANVLRDMPDVKQACIIYPCSPLLMKHDLQVSYDILTGLRDHFTDFVMSVGWSPLRDAGNFYWGHRHSFLDRSLASLYTRMYVLPNKRVCDVNTPEDWAECERKFEAMYAS